LPPCTAFLRSVLRLLVTVNVVPSSPIVVILSMKVIRTSETLVLTRATRQSSQSPPRKPQIIQGKGRVTQFLLSYTLRHEHIGGSGGIVPPFLTLALDVDQLHDTAALTPRKEPMLSTG
jgi:hypothetical protein